MKGDILKRILLVVGSKEYNDVETELKKTGLAANVLTVCSVSDNHKRAFSPELNGHFASE